MGSASAVRDAEAALENLVEDVAGEVEGLLGDRAGGVGRAARDLSGLLRNRPGHRAGHVAGAAFDAQAFQGAWESYRLLLMRAAENVTTASYGRSFPAIFWLWHSGTMARALKETPKRYLRRDLTAGRDWGDTLKYRVFQKVIDRLTNLNYELVQRLSSDTEEDEEQLFPALFTRILTLRELPTASYYGYMLLYNAAYMVDDIVVLGIGVTLLSRHRLQEKEGRALKLLSGLVMVGLGVYLIVAD